MELFSIDPQGLRATQQEVPHPRRQLGGTCSQVRSRDGQSVGAERMWMSYGHLTDRFAIELLGGAIRLQGRSGCARRPYHRRNRKPARACRKRTSPSAAANNGRCVLRLDAVAPADRLSWFGVRGRDPGAAERVGKPRCWDWTGRPQGRGPSWGCWVCSTRPAQLHDTVMTSWPLAFS